MGMFVSSLRMPVRFATIFLRRYRVFLRFRVASMLMVMCRLAMMMRGQLMIGRGIMMMLTRRMLRCRHGFLLFRLAAYWQR